MSTLLMSVARYACVSSCSSSLWQLAFDKCQYASELVVADCAGVIAVEVLKVGQNERAVVRDASVETLEDGAEGEKGLGGERRWEREGVGEDDTGGHCEWAERQDQ